MFLNGFPTTPNGPYLSPPHDSPTLSTYTVDICRDSASVSLPRMFFRVSIGLAHASSNTGVWFRSTPLVVYCLFFFKLISNRCVMANFISIPSFTNLQQVSKNERISNHHPQSQGYILSFKRCFSTFTSV